MVYQHITNLRDDAIWYMEFWSIDETDVFEQPERSHSEMFLCSQSRSKILILNKYRKWWNILRNYKIKIF